MSHTDKFKRRSPLQPKLDALTEALQGLLDAGKTDNGWVTWHQLREWSKWGSDGATEMSSVIQELVKRGTLEQRGGNVGPAMVKMVEAKS